MSNDQHAQPPPDPAPLPRRRDDTSPAAGHHGHDTRLRDAWLAEMWAPVREYVPAQEPKKAPKKRGRRKSRATPPDSPDISTGCAEERATESVGTASECA